MIISSRTRLFFSLISLLAIPGGIMPSFFGLTLEKEPNTVSKEASKQLTKISTAINKLAQTVFATIKNQETINNILEKIRNNVNQSSTKIDEKPGTSDLKIKDLLKTVKDDLNQSKEELLGKLKEIMDDGIAAENAIEDAVSDFFKKVLENLPNQKEILEELEKTGNNFKKKVAVNPADIANKLKTKILEERKSIVAKLNKAIETAEEKLTLITKKAKGKNNKQPKEKLKQD